MASQKLCVGIDIGASAVKICQLQSIKGGYRLEHFAAAPLPPDTLVEGAMMSSARVLEALRTAMLGSKLRGKEAALSISGRSTIIKTLTLPTMRPDELEQGASKEVAQSIPFAVADVYLDLAPTRPSHEHQGQMEVLLVAAKKVFVDEFIDVVAEAGMRATVCDIDAYALQTLYEKAHGKAGAAPIVLCNLGAVKTNLNVMQDGQSTFVRDLEWGAARLTTDIAAFYGIAFDEAEAIKVEQRPLPPELQTKLQGTIDLFVGELLRTLDFYASAHNDVGPASLFYCGGGANDPRILKGLREAVALPLYPIDLRRCLSIPPQWEPTFAMAGLGAALCAGLALRYPGDGDHAAP